MSIQVDPATIRRMLMHEAQVHSTPGRTLRDLGDSILLSDPADPEPFWNRLTAIRWPDAADAFDRRLTEILVIFATIARQPHIWPSPAHDTPADLIARLESNGFRDMGAGMVMARSGAERNGLATAALPPGVTLERTSRLEGGEADTAAGPIVAVLADAFDVMADRTPGIKAETAVSLTNPWFTHYVLRFEGQPAAVARLATFDGLSYLSSIGTASWARGRGFGRVVTAEATRDALLAGSEWAYLGVYAENKVAIQLYEGLGYERVGDAGPDLLLV